MTDVTVQEKPLPVSRRGAIATGATRYFTGKPCRAGHIAERNIHGACTECTRLAKAERYKRNADQINEKLRASYAASQSLRDAARERKRRYYHGSKEEVGAASRLWREANSERVKEASRLWREENKDKARETRRAYKKSRRNTDPAFVLAERMNSAINKAMRNGGYSKRSRTHEYVGCSYDDLKCHIERQFLKGMTWSNRGEWHIDHIVPQCSATTEDELIALQHYTNLRPAWAGDNIAKGGRRTFLI